MSKLSTLTFEKALGRLLGLMGRRVKVSILSEEPRGLLATFEGELSAGGEVRERGYWQGEAFVFQLVGSEAASFVLETRMLRQACLVATPADQPESLRFYVSVSTVLQVDPLDHAPADG